MNIFMNIHFNIHSVFKAFHAFRLGHVVLQLLQGSRTPSETFLGVGGMFILLINLCTSDTIYRLLCKHRPYSRTFSTSDKSIVYL